MFRSCPIAVDAGAIMDEAMGVMKVIRETSPVASHLLPKDQVLGLELSLGPSQVTYVS